MCDGYLDARGYKKIYKQTSFLRSVTKMRKLNLDSVQISTYNRLRQGLIGSRFNQNIVYHSGIFFRLYQYEETINYPLSYDDLLQIAKDKGWIGFIPSIYNQYKKEM